MTRILIALTAAALALTVGVSTASAGHVNYKARAARQARQLRAANATIRTQAATISTQAATIQTDTAKLATDYNTINTDNRLIGARDAQIRLLTAQRNSAWQTMATLQAELNVEPDSLAYAEQQVRYEVSWAEGSSTNTLPAGALVALSAMDYVEGHVSAGAYGYRLHHGLALPQGNAQSVLAYQAGICGHAALTFAAIVKALGYPVRSVQFYYSTPTGAPDSHIADEVYYAGGWHFFDATFGAFWQTPSGDITSITDARAGAGTEQRDKVAFTNLVEDPWYAGDDTAFETDPATTVTLDQQPFTG